MNLAGLSIGQPWILWALLLCPVVLIATWRNRVDTSRTLLAAATIARVLAIAFVVFALADARMRWPTRKLAVAFVQDPSLSVSPRENASVSATVPRARIERDDVRWIEPFGVTNSQARTVDTNLETLIQTAAGALPTDRARRIVLATDGRETRGDVLAAADAARRSGIQVLVLPEGDSPVVDALAVSGLEVPRLIRAGRNVTFGVRLFSQGDRSVQLDVLRDGERVAREQRDVRGGSGILDLTASFPDEGVHELTVRASTDGDAIAENNVYRMLVRVVSPPRVLLVHELAAGSPALGDVYRDAHLHVDEVHPDAVPIDAATLDRYQFIVLDEIVMTSLSESQQRAIRAWVEDRGGGLLTTTGMHGIGREPELLREIEPVQPPRAVPEPRPIELILVIDRSGSMQGPNIVNARNAGIAAVRALRPDSRVGLVAFSGSADVQVPPVAVADSEQVVRAIAGIHAGGGTDLAAALNAAATMVSNDPRYLHHVILMSDGESHPEPAIAAAAALRETGATVTAITLGPRVPLMSQIAQIGHGRYHVTSTSTSLPALFVHEAQFRSPPPSRDQIFRPGLRARMGFMQGYDPEHDPPVGGFTVSQPRPGSLTLLTAPSGEPLLSHWFVGLGQVATLTTATSSRWADTWRTGEGFRRLFSQMAWEMLRVQGEDNLEMHVENVPGRADVRRVSIVAPNTAIDPAPIATLSRGRLQGVRLALHAAAPGVWTANVALERGFVVDARMPASLEPSIAAGAEVPYPGELRTFGVDEPMLASIARAGGGRVIHRLDEALGDVPSQRVLREMRLPLLVAALASYLLGLLAMRLPRRPRSSRPRSKGVEDNSPTGDREAA